MPYVTYASRTGDVQVHDGFADAQEQTADAILAAVQSGLSDSGYSKVLVTGHSLGSPIDTRLAWIVY